MNALQPIIIVGIVFYAIIEFVRILSDNRLRNKLIDKGMVDEKIRFLYHAKSASLNPSSLKWGIVLVAIGAAFLIGHIFPESVEEDMMIALMFLFSGVGLILFYFMESIKSKQTE